MKRALKGIIVIFLIVIFITPLNAQAAACNTILGDPGNSNSVAWLLDKILSYIQVLGPMLVIILSSVDFAKVIIQSDDEAMAKAQKKLIIRLALAACLFFLPVIVKVLLGAFGLTTCGIG